MGPASLSSQCKVLVIEDDEPFRTSVTLFLSKNGFEPMPAADGEEGLALARQHVPDLVLCDLEMPRIDGYEVLLAMHRDPALASIPTIFLTGRSEPSMIRFGMNLGADDYLTKPIEPEDLLQAIKARLARVHHLRTSLRPSSPTPSGLEDTFLVKTPKEMLLIKIRQVTHLLAYGEYSWVYWENSKGAMLRKSLKQWVAHLPEQFIRVHRAAIINLAFLERIESLPSGGIQVRLRQLAQPVPVSVRLAPNLRRRLRQFSAPQSHSR